MSARDLHDLAAWADRAARWLEQSARRPNDADNPNLRTVVFEAAILDDFLTGFRGMPEVVKMIASNLEQRPGFTVVAAGRQ